MTHAEILSEVLAIAKAQAACASEYRRAEQSKDMAELTAVLRDNFHWCCDLKLLTPDTITRWGLGDHGIHCNENVTSGYCLAYGSATVRAYDTATVRAYGSATVEAYDSATVRAYGSATVRAYGSATVRAYGSATVEAYDSATVRAYDSATVRAYDRAYVHAPCAMIECKLNDHAVLRHGNTITAANGQTIIF